jgi:hypothetical protein
MEFDNKIKEIKEFLKKWFYIFLFFIYINKYKI